MGNETETTANWRIADYDNMDDKEPSRVIVIRANAADEAGQIGLMQQLPREAGFTAERLISGSN